MIEELCTDIINESHFGVVHNYYSFLQAIKHLFVLVFPVVSPLLLVDRFSNDAVRYDLKARYQQAGENEGQCNGSYREIDYLCEVEEGKYQD